MALLDSLPGSVRIVEVAPRDGLQNEPRVVPTDLKAAFIQKLVEAGHRHVEVSSLVRPDRVPQLADAEALLSRLHCPPGVRFTVLVPNERGLDRALRAGVRSIALFTAASDSFSRENTGMSVDDSLAAQGRIAERARREGLRMRAYVSTAFVCPFEGPVQPLRTAEVVRRLDELAIGEISLGDTIGAASPLDVDRLLDAIRATRARRESGPSGLDGIALHMHDTRGRALANVLMGLQHGVEEFDASAGGLGGCPFAPGASGNLDTAVLVRMLESMGIATGIDVEAQQRAVEELRRAAGF